MIADEPIAKPVGRPTDYTPEIAARFCEHVLQGKSMREISAIEGMPDKATICRWLARHEEFSDQYARAKRIAIELELDATLEIADDGRNDWVDRQIAPGVVRRVVDREAIERSKLRVDTRKWFASKLLPKKYGDRVTQTHEGGDQPVRIVVDTGIRRTEG